MAAIDIYKGKTTTFSQVILHGEVVPINCSKALIELSRDLYTFTVDFKSQIFLNIWKQMISDALKKPKEDDECVKLDDIVNCVWKPAIDFCIQIITDLHTSEITLRTIDNQFKCLDSIEKQLISFLAAIKQVFGDEKGPSLPGNDSWLDDRIITIKQYWNFKRYSNDASVFLSLKEVLEIDGDFSVVRHLASNVSYLLLCYNTIFRG